VPVLVNPVVMKDTMADVKLGMEILVGPDELELRKKKQQAQIMAQKQEKPVKLAQTGNPVVNPPFNNWSVNQPSPTHDIGMAGKADLGQQIIVDGHHVQFAQVASKGNGNEDLGLHMKIDGMNISVAQKEKKEKK